MRVNITDCLCGTCGPCQRRNTSTLQDAQNATISARKRKIERNNPPMKVPRPYVSSMGDAQPAAVSITSSEDGSLMTSAQARQRKIDRGSAASAVSRNTLSLSRGISGDTLRGQ